MDNPTQDSQSELDAIFDKLKTDAANARASCTERKNWEDYNGKYDKFEHEAKQAIEAYVTTRVKEALELARSKDPHKCEFGHEVYSHNTVDGWCCACEADQAFMEARVKEAREPLVRILEKSDYGKCLECGEFYHDDDMTFCEACDSAGEDSGMHEWCAGTTYSGDGEYPAESAYALCKKHSKPLTTTTNGKEE